MVSENRVTVSVPRWDHSRDLQCPLSPPEGCHSFRAPSHWPSAEEPNETLGGDCLHRAHGPQSFPCVVH